MVKKGLYLGIVLVFGMTIIGCDLGREPELLTGNISFNAPFTYTLKVGDTINIFTNNINGTGELSYHWYRDNIRISEANNSSYTLTDNDVGKLISINVSRAGYTGTVGTNFRNSVLPSTAPDLTGTISIDGMVKVGETLTANTQALDGEGEIYYQWWIVTVHEGGGWSGSWSGSDSNSTFVIPSSALDRNILLRVYRINYYKQIEFTTDSVVTAAE